MEPDWSEALLNWSIQYSVTEDWKCLVLILKCHGCDKPHKIGKRDAATTATKTCYMFTYIENDSNSFRRRPQHFWKELKFKFGAELTSNYFCPETDWMWQIMYLIYADLVVIYHICAFLYKSVERYTSMSYTILNPSVSLSFVYTLFLASSVVNRQLCWKIWLSAWIKFYPYIHEVYWCIIPCLSLFCKTKHVLENIF